MANTRTVGSSGANHTTWSDAEAWATTNHNFTADDMFFMQSNAAEEIVDNLDIAGIAGIPSSSAHVEMRAGASYYHSGKAGTGSRIRNTTNGQHVIHNQINYTYIHHLVIQQDSSGGSDEGIRCDAALGQLISRCVIFYDNSAADVDLIYAGDWDTVVTIDNCVVYGATRGGANAQNYHATNGRTQTWYIDYCTFVKNGASGEGETGIHGRTGRATDQTNMNVTNTYSDDSGNGNCFDETDSDTNVDWTGDRNSASDTTANSYGMTNAQNSVAVNTTTFTNVTGGSEDYSIPSTSSTLYNNGSSITVRDSRQSFGTDIVGNTRSTNDIGAFAFVSVGESGSLSSGADAGDTFSAIASSAGILTSAADAGDTLSAGASSAGLLTSAAQAGDSYTRVAHFLAFITEGAQAGDSDTSLAQALGSIAAGATGSEVFGAIAQAAASLVAGAAAGETWAGSVTTPGGQSGVLTAGTQASDTFVAAAQTLASYSEGATVTDAISAIASVLGAISEGAVAGSLFEYSAANSVSFTSAANAGAVISAISSAVAAITEAVEADALFEAQITAQALFSSGAIAGSVFSYAGVTGALSGAVTLVAATSAAIVLDPSTDGSISIN